MPMSAADPPAASKKRSRLPSKVPFAAGASVRITARPPTGTAGGSTVTECAAERPGAAASHRPTTSAPTPSRSPILVLAGLDSCTKPAAGEPDAELLAQAHLGCSAQRRRPPSLPDHGIAALEHAERREARQGRGKPCQPFAREHRAIPQRSREPGNRLLDSRPIPGDAPRGRRK